MQTLPPESAEVRTTLVHRRRSGSNPWWKSAVICDVPGGVDELQLREVEPLAFDLARLGFQAVSVALASQEQVWGDAADIAPFVERMHRVGLKVLVRLPGADLPAPEAEVDISEGLTTLVGRVRACVEAGVDGIDLGRISPPAHLRGDVPPEVASWQAQRFSRLVRVLLSELGQDEGAPVLTAESPVSDPVSLTSQLREDAFHMLRDASLANCPWDARRLHETLSANYRVRDWADRVSAWTWSRMHHLHDALEVPRFAHPAASGMLPATSWENGASAARRDAMGLFALSLPGSAHVPLLDVGGDVLVGEDATVHRVWSKAPLRHVRQERIGLVLRTRTRRGMGTGSMATIDGLDWIHEGVGVHLVSGVLVVLNTSRAPVTVPSEYELLVSSTGAEAEAGGAFDVVPESCAWFVTPRVEAPPTPVQF
ncbi:hypothetical protein I6B53_07660 [Schaalia sp. 19OD2882]|uniref:hypothetical protein n=1 Tax=Schaalia sp. 19OD2882 TaxID=2794089 RepID=UPI001C1F0A76|nr:hypothetical protein [Schaalia sp. 19OD2882]QWW19008.1 hypothetical protein I6B53_07660 [Schaalia sp. 19OD2882]